MAPMDTTEADRSPQTATDAAEIERRLTDLERASDERRRELREMASELPAALSRRALVSGVLTDLRHAPNKGAIARRGFSKLARSPKAVARRMIRRRP